VRTFSAHLPTPRIHRPLGRVLVECWINRVMVSSNLARELSAAVGIAASCGYITARRGRAQLFGRQWLITKKGLGWLDDSEKGRNTFARGKKNAAKSAVTKAMG
jgi:hypothetical protein